jgi:Phosphotransferase enzyme family
MTSTSAPTRRVVGSVAELLAGATDREPMKTADSKSSAPFERLRLAGEPHVVKYLSWETDWITRATDDRWCRVLRMWRAGTFDRLPACIEPAIVGVAHEAGSGLTAVLMRDVGAHLVPDGNAPLPLGQHRRFVEHMARLHATLWDWPDPDVLTPPRVRYSALSPATGARERSVGGVPALLEASWTALLEADPEAGRLALSLATDPAPLLAALAGTPQCFVHGDWKAGNLGSLPDGRTVLLDWQWPGRAAPLVDLVWYVAVNCDRLPESKEDTIQSYRDALERCGVSTADWWERQLPLALLGAFVQLGWNKAGDAAELGWWAERALAAARLLP